MGRARERVLGVMMSGAMALAGLAGGPPANAAPLVPCESNPPAPPPPSPTCDHWYDPPSLGASDVRGTILKQRPATITGGGIPVPSAAEQLMYVSSDSGGNPAAAVATVILPLTPSTITPRPLVSYQTAEDGLSMVCAPSYRYQTGQDKDEVALPGLLAQGWAVIVSDYEGLRSEYTAGVQAAHGVLDGIRAALNYGPAGFTGATPIGLWGYSGGALASAWASELAPTYAPELNIVAVAEGGVPANLANIAKHLDGGFFSGIELAGAVGLSRAYPTVAGHLNAAGQAMAASIGTQCIETFLAQYPNRRMNDYTTEPNVIDLPDVAAIMAANSLGNAVPAAPLYMYHAINDELIPVADVNALVAKYCAEGVKVAYYQDVASEHISLAFSGASAAMGYLAARFAGVPAPSTCGVPTLSPSAA